MLHIIHNPNSGRGTLTSADLIFHLNAEKIPYVLHTSSDVEETAELFRSLRLTAGDHIVLIGGDGSLNQLINLLPEEDTPSVILLPAGSGNDFARGLRMKRGRESVIHMLKEADRLSPALLDCGEARIQGGLPRKFAVSCGIGYDAGVCLMINRSRVKGLFNKLHLGKLIYLLMGVRGIASYRKARLTLAVDDEEPRTYDNLAFLSCHNLPFEGGGFSFAPGASARDGQLSLCLVTARSRALFTLTLIFSLFRLHGMLPNVHMITCRKAEIHVSEPLPFHTDGEASSGVTDCTVRCRGRLLPVLFEPDQN